MIRLSLYQKSMANHHELVGRRQRRFSRDSAVGAEKLGVIDDRALFIESQIPFSSLVLVVL